MDAKAYLHVNRELWNKMTAVHVETDFYGMEDFKKGKSSLQAIELELFEELRGKKILHLQCHFGQDTLSLARMGAQVTGVDLSDQAIEEAKRLADELGISARFIQSDIFQLDKILHETFDYVFTSYGVIGWLPELESWGKIINHFLKPGGKFLMVEFHQMVWMFDEDFSQITYSYFNDGALIEEVESSYADSNSVIKQQSYQWNHNIAEVISALLEQKLTIQHFKEYDYSPYNCFNNTVKTEKGYQIKGYEGKIPMIFSIIAKK